MRWLLGVIAFGLAMMWWGHSRAEWQVHMQVGEVWVPAVTTRGTVAKIFADDENFKCAWALVEMTYGVVSGTRLQCRKIKPR